MRKRLYKSDNDKAIFGVCGGIAEYFDIDSLVVRLVLVLFSLAYGAGLAFYIIAALVMPKRPSISERRFDPPPQGAASYNVGGMQYVNRASGFRGEAAAAASVADSDGNLSVEDAERLAAKYAAFSGESAKAFDGSESDEDMQRADARNRYYEGEQSYPRQGIPEEEYYRDAYSQEPSSRKSNSRYVGGPLLIAVGILILLKKFLPWLDGWTIVALGTIAAGLFILLKKD